MSPGVRAYPPKRGHATAPVPLKLECDVDIGQAGARALGDLAVPALLSRRPDLPKEWIAWNAFPQPVK